MQVEWWYWIIAGFCLIGLELIFPSFTIIWFGLGAVAVGILKALWPDLPFMGQIFLWPVASVCFTIMWYKYLKPKGSKTPASPYGEGIIGETGTVIRWEDARCERWTVRLRIPVQGADEWCCYADEVLQVGDTVKVTEVEGQILKVAKIQGHSQPV